jgi:hypothetical protein
MLILPSDAPGADDIREIIIKDAKAAMDARDATPRPAPQLRLVATNPEHEHDGGDA